MFEFQLTESGACLVMASRGSAVASHQDMQGCFALALQTPSRAVGGQSPAVDMQLLTLVVAWLCRDGLRRGPAHAELCPRRSQTMLAEPRRER